VPFDVTSLFNRRAEARWERVCTADLVERLIWSTPNREAIVGWRGASSTERFARLTFRQMNDLANQVANGLRGQGVERGDRVVMICENSVEGYVFRLGVAKLGAVTAPLNPALRSDVIEHLLTFLEPRLVVVDAELYDGVQGSLAATGLRADVTIEIGGSAIPGSVSFQDFVDAQPTTEPDATVHGDDIAEILCTSGTTAMPKGVMLSHTSSTLAAHGFALSLTRGLRFEGDLVLVSFLPMMYHIGHQIFGLATMAAGGRFIIGRRPDPVQIVEAIEQEKATALWGGSPAMVDSTTALAESQASDITSLTVVVYGWAALNPTVYDRLQSLAPGVQPLAIFGQTESISCHRFWPDQEMDLYRETAPRENYVGLPCPLLASKVVGPFGEPLNDEPRVVGEAVYRSPVMTSGYYRDEEATRTAFDGGWFHSGDSCLYDERGLRIMVDRFKDIVKSGGENVSSLRVESILVQHPNVQKVAVVGLPDDHWGEAVTAVVVPEGEQPDPDALIAFARKRLAGFETPKRVIFTEQLPETVGGKIMKYKLRQELRSEATKSDG
jgi:acyl-CoA synthetase (AMP-forming)/AMP-acid ligase II